MNLNPEQLRAVTATTGPIIIKAGPGTGKTRTLIARIEYLISTQNVFPQHIFALTFTRKAAAEMKERLSHFTEKPVVTTFHGLAFDVLRMKDDKLEIIQDGDRNEVIQMIVEKQTDKTTSKKDVKELSQVISRRKNSFDGIPGQARNDIDSILNAYNHQLIERNVMDYDDLILSLYQELKKKNETIIAKLKEFTHVLVDEFQDTNPLQYEVIKLFCTPQNLFVIGDPYQSIYGFRGADSSIFETVTNDFPGCIEITLIDNYRSTQNIIDCSFTLFPGITPLISTQKGEGSIALVKTYNEYTEAEYVLTSINKHMGGVDLLRTDQVADNTTMRFSDIAVIYRTHHIGRSIESVFLESAIPFQVIGGDSPYEKKSIRFISLILRYCVNQTDDILKGLLYASLAKLHAKTLRTIRSIQQDQNVRYSEAVQAVATQAYVDKKERQKLSTFINNLKNIVEKAQSLKISEIIHIICPQWGIETDINLQQYISCALQYDTPGLSTFVQYLDYLEDHEFYDEAADRVTLMTMHAAKGLEFDTVFICGFEEGIIPFIKNESSDIEEEKRLLYVALTRAKRNIYLTYPLERMKRKTTRSRFVESLLSEGLTEMEDESIGRMQVKMQKRKDKKSQPALF